MKSKTKNDSYVLVVSFKECIRIVEEILLKQEVIALDCEGIYLSKEGRLTLVQVAISSGEVYIFDIMKGGSIMFLGLDSKTKRGLKSIFESSSIVKIIHDCRSDWESLLHQYEVRLHNFIDSQEAYFVYKLFYYQEIVNPISLSNFLLEFQGVKLNYKSKMKNLMGENPELWGERPLQADQLNYAAEDVAFLISAYLKLESCLNKNLTEMSYFMTIIKVVNKPLFDQFKEHLISTVLHMISYHKKLVKDGSPEDSSNSNKSIAEIVVGLADYDYVDNFFQFKSLYDKEKSEENIITIGVSYKNMQRDYFEKLIQPKTESIADTDSKTQVGNCSDGSDFDKSTLVGDPMKYNTSELSTFNNSSNNNGNRCYKQIKLNNFK